MEIRTAHAKDTPQIALLDHHIAFSELQKSISLGRVYIAQENGRLIGWLRYNLFWDNTPFMNMLYLIEEERKKDLERR